MTASFLKLEYFDNLQELRTDRVQNNAFYYRIKPFQNSDIFESTICQIKKLTQGADIKTTYEVIFNTKNEGSISNFSHFSPGDAIAILPQNNENEVNNLLKRLNLDSVSDKYYELKVEENCTKKVPGHIPVVGTLKETFLKYVDIRNVPKKIFLKSLLSYTINETDKKKLEFICSPNGSKQYEELISTHRTLLQLLETFPSCNPPVETILQHSTSLKPRYFSISSPSGSKISIIFSVVEFENGLKGVCTGWLETVIQKDCKNSEKIVPFYFRKPTDFNIINDSERKIFIGNGTGLAPFMTVLRDPSIKEKNFNTTWLFYGCRYKDRDFLCREDILTLAENGVIKLNVAFSRDQLEKHYVQDEILKNFEGFDEFLFGQNKTAKIYVCGSIQMVKEVRKTIVKCLAKVKKVDISMAEEIFTKLDYCVDSWM